jgi:hypothetical protein
MSIEEDLKIKLKNNQRTLCITDADDLLAVWQFKRNNKFTRSVDFSRVPKEWRCSAPPDNNSPLMPCHVTYGCKSGRLFFKKVKSDFGLSTISCHGHGRMSNISAPDIDTLEVVTFAKKNVAPYVSPILDAGTLTLVCKDLGITGRAIPKVINGRQYIAFTGYPGLRTRFPGTIYSANNRKIITMAIGALGIKNMVKTGGILTISITVPLAILEAFLLDHSSIYELVGNLASDLIKIGISSVIGAVVGIAFGGIVTVAALPIAITIAVSVGAGIGLAALDKQYKLTEKLSVTLENLSNQIVEGTHNGIDETKRSLYRGFEGFIRGQTGYRGPL